MCLRGSKLKEEKYIVPEEQQDQRLDDLQCVIIMVFNSVVAVLLRTDELERAEDPELVRMLNFLSLEELNRQVLQHGQAHIVQ